MSTTTEPGNCVHYVFAFDMAASEEREKFRAFTRQQRLKRDCPFPPEPDQEPA